MSTELGNNTFGMADAQLAWDAGGLELRLVDVWVTDPNGTRLMQAPRAVLGLSGAAALRGRLALSRIAVVNPRLQAFYTEDGTLSVKFARAADASQTATSDAATTPLTPLAPDESAQPIDFVKAITTISAQARRREHATAYLHEIGLQHATLIIDNGHRKTIWKLPEVRLDLSHKASRSLISGRAVIDSLTAPWSLDFQTAETDSAQQLAINAQVAGLNPRGLARQVPAMAAFEQLDVPLDGEARIDFSSKGAISKATFALKARPGRLVAGAASRFSANVGAGSLTGSYDPAGGMIKISEASLSVEQNRLDAAGTIARARALSPEGQSLWDFQFASTGGVLAPATPDGPPVPIDELRVMGRAVPEAGRVELHEIAFKAGGASISGQGSVNELAVGANRVAGLEARIAPMTLSQLIALWPSTIEPEARTWLATHITRGQLNGGTLKVASGGENRLSLSLDIGATEIVALKGGPPLDIPRGTLRLEGGGLEMTVPDASIGVEGRRLLLKGLRVTAVDTSDGTAPIAEVAFRVLGPLAAAVDIADREPFRLLKSKGISLQSPEGRLDGQIKLTLPLAQNLQVSDIRAQGRVRLTDGRVRQVLGSHDITGAKIDVELSDTAIDARGDLLLKGIPIKFAGQHFLNSNPERQSPLRLTLKLDDADRAQLGLDINDLVTGEVPIEITVSPDAKGVYQVSLSGDLTKAELTLDSVAYRKPPGVPARVQFSPIKAAPGRTELRNFKLAGETIAAEGMIVLGPDNKARELSFPDFTMNVITRLDVQGRLRPDNVWDVRAKGVTFDGRELFRDLFNVQQQAKPVPKDKPGIDLTAEVDTVLGFSDTSLKDVRLTMQRRSATGIDRTTALKVTAKHESGKPFEATIRSAGERKLIATSQDAGQIFKAVGFYPNAVGGRMSLEVSLDGAGVAERNGLLRTEQFAILGDPVVSEVFQTNDGGKPIGGGRKKIVREQIDFDWMVLPFSVGCGQFVMNDMEIRGPLIGATLRGKADFKSQRLQVGGTYVPLSGLNSAIGVIPGIGQLLTGPKGEGIFGITFAVIGSMANPEVLINPLSGILPGILRETQQLTPATYRITPCAVAPIVTQRPEAARASSAGPTTAGRTPAAATPRAQPPDVLSDWSSDQRSDTKRLQQPR